MYKVGDKVEIVNYGHRIYHRLNDGDDMTPIDINPTIIGRQGIIIKVSQHNTYSIDGIGAWYNNDQLKLIKEYN